MGLIETGCGLTSSRIESSTTSFAFEVLRLLMRDENLEIVKVSLTVITPRSREDLFRVRVGALLLAHLDVWSATVRGLTGRHTKTLL